MLSRRETSRDVINRLCLRYFFVVRLIVGSMSSCRSSCSAISFAIETEATTRSHRFTVAQGYGPDLDRWPKVQIPFGSSHRRRTGSCGGPIRAPSIGNGHRS